MRRQRDLADDTPVLCIEHSERSLTAANVDSVTSGVVPDVVRILDLSGQSGRRERRTVEYMTYFISAAGDKKLSTIRNPCHALRLVESTESVATSARAQINDFD
jgi:hypothetical protein